MPYEGIMGKRSGHYSVLFFMLGLIGALGFRIVLLLNKIDALLASVTWYTAVIAYIFFYLYRLHIENKRIEIVRNYKLIEKVERGELSKSDRERLKTLLDSIMVSKQKANLQFLVAISVITLALQIAADILI